MSGFLYFRSRDTRAVDLDTVRSWGLGYAFDGSPETRGTNEKSPSNAPGLVFADPSRQNGRAVGVDLSSNVRRSGNFVTSDAQTWYRKTFNPAGPELWVGYWNDAKPTPEDLRRREMLRGDSIRLGDGHQWQIPLVREVDQTGTTYECALPRNWELDEQGRWCKGDVVEIYRHLWELTTPFAYQQFAKDSGTVNAELESDGQVNDAATALLQVNYRLQAAEIVALRLFTDTGSLALIPLMANHYSWLIDKMREKKTE